MLINLASFGARHSNWQTIFRARIQAGDAAGCSTVGWFVRELHQAGQPSLYAGFWIRAARRALTYVCSGLSLHGAYGTINPSGLGLQRCHGGPQAGQRNINNDFVIKHHGKIYKDHAFLFSKLLGFLLYKKYAIDDQNSLGLFFRNFSSCVYRLHTNMF